MATATTEALAVGPRVKALRDGMDLSLDWHVLAFTTAIAISTCILFGF